MSEDSLVGKQLGEYQLEDLLAQGGMARVYRAVDVRLQRHAVVKVIDPPSRNDPGYVMRFEREAQIISRLDHSNIVRLYRFDEEDGWLYMAMQHIEGADLGVVLASYRADKEFMDPDDARRIIRETCSALDYAHENGVIHRDVKPANILLDRHGRAFLSDFGLALITAVGTRGEIFGSAHYIAPEQAVSSAKAVPQSDLYAIGIILYEMFTGDVPFKAATPLDIALLHISEPPIPPRQLRPDINPELEAVILKAMAKKPEERYPTGAALSDALEHALDARSAATLIAPHSSASHHTIPERVALELGQPPLPPIPAAVAVSAPPPAEESAPVETIASVADRRPATYTGALVGLGIMLLLALLCTVLAILPSLTKRLGQGEIMSTGRTPTTLAASTESSEIVSVTQSEATSPATSAPNGFSANPLPTETPVRYTLLIVRGQDGNSLIVVNLSAAPFPLSLLQLGNGNAALRGSAWGVDNLENKACVGAWKAGENREPPGGIACDMAGALELKKKDLFGGDTFVVFYAGKQVGTCTQNQLQCSISILP
ncbi:MAG TPA: protein kinase [Anaerolineales bacterium]|nr:protein kinase [Anaerolineales bacterium]